MNRNYVDEPYTEKDADRYRQWLKHYIDRPAPAFEKRQHVKPGDPNNAKIAINVLRTIVKEVHGIYYDATRAGGTNFQVQELGRYIAHLCHVEMIPGPIKSHAGAYRKLGLTHAKHDSVDHSERYETAGQLKDIARITLCATSTSQYDSALAKLRAFCVSANKMSLKKNDVMVAEKNPCGYSGATIVAVLPNKRFGEVQVNVRSIMYGKMSKADFCRDLRVSTDAYARLKTRYGVDGGLGHAFYEVWRVDKHGANGLEAARLSTLYYNLLRLPSADPGMTKFFTRGVDAFKRENPEVFTGH